MMDYLEAYIPKTLNQVRLTVILVAFTGIVILRRLLRKKRLIGGKVVVITGASSGIGEALAHKCVERGCRVILVARNMEKLDNLKLELIRTYKAAANSVTPVFLDLEDHDSIPKACQRIISLFGRVDILINNAGIGCKAKVADLELDTFKKVMNINYFGQIAVTKGILPNMIEKGGGTIVAVSSVQGRMAVPGYSSYGASKHALQAFCDSLRSENKRHDIDVLVVSPSYVTTPFAQATLSGEGSPLSGQRLQELKSTLQAGMTPEYCASEIIAAIRTYETDYLIGPWLHRMFVYIRVISPWLFHTVMSTQD
ncbi:dehydrogenase/reductase SDR family protein 7-like [Watersipora subatra]|uniref:dehydrogenase/reductase SDR family protein 7-like n=1 Tax=Watersipora subatra TaxID=2589382 RepID=UPI00355BE948